jgi:hypothetical protein
MRAVMESEARKQRSFSTGDPSKKNNPTLAGINNKVFMVTSIEIKHTTKPWFPPE